jgi:hypothetical protein
VPTIRSIKSLWCHVSYTKPSRQVKKQAKILQVRQVLETFVRAEGFGIVECPFREQARPSLNYCLSWNLLYSTWTLG